MQEPAERLPRMLCFRIYQYTAGSIHHAQKCVCCIDHTNHVFVGRIYDGTVHTSIHSKNHKCLVNIFLTGSPKEMLESPLVIWISGYSYLILLQQSANTVSAVWSVPRVTTSGSICKRLGAMPYCFAFSIIPKKIFIRRSTESGIPSLSQRRATHSQSVSAITGKNRVNFVSFKGNRVNKSRSFTKWNGCNAGSGTWTVHTDWCICHFLYKVDHPFQGFYFYSLFY